MSKLALKALDAAGMFFLSYCWIYQRCLKIQQSWAVEEIFLSDACNSVSTFPGILLLLEVIPPLLWPPPFVPPNTLSCLSVYKVKTHVAARRCAVQKTALPDRTSPYSPYSHTLCFALCLGCFSSAPEPCGLYMIKQPFPPSHQRNEI